MEGRKRGGGRGRRRAVAHAVQAGVDDRDRARPELPGRDGRLSRDAAPPSTRSRERRRVTYRPGRRARGFRNSRSHRRGAPGEPGLSAPVSLSLVGSQTWSTGDEHGGEDDDGGQHRDSCRFGLGLHADTWGREPLSAYALRSTGDGGPAPPSLLGTPALGCCRPRQHPRIGTEPEPPSQRETPRREGRVFSPPGQGARCLRCPGVLGPGAGGGLVRAHPWERWAAGPCLVLAMAVPAGASAEQIEPLEAPPLTTAAPSPPTTGGASNAGAGGAISTADALPGGIAPDVSVTPGEAPASAGADGSPSPAEVSGRRPSLVRAISAS